MGWGAAYAFYEENRAWLNSPEEAYELLYPHRVSDKSGFQRSRCPLCNKRLTNRRGVEDHLQAVHAKRLAEDKVLEWRAFCNKQRDR